MFTGGKNRGATLIEVLVVIILVSTSVMILTLTFPRAAANITQSRRQFFANSLASSQMRTIIEAPYSNIDPTPRLNFSTAEQGIYPTRGCNCDAENLSSAQFRILPDYTEAGVTYEIHQCIHLVAELNPGTWSSYCDDNSHGEDGADRGTKSIRVRVLWQSGPDQKFTDLKSLVRR